AGDEGAAAGVSRVRVVGLYGQAGGQRAAARAGPRMGGSLARSRRGRCANGRDGGGGIEMGGPVGEIPVQIRAEPETLDVFEVESPRVLLVDDDERNLLAVQSILEDLGEVVLAGSGEEALRYLLKGEFAV